MPIQKQPTYHSPDISNRNKSGAAFQVPPWKVWHKINLLFSSLSPLTLISLNPRNLRAEWHKFPKVPRNLHEKLASTPHSVKYALSLIYQGALSPAWVHVFNALLKLELVFFLFFCYRCVPQFFERFGKAFKRIRISLRFLRGLMMNKLILSVEGNFWGIFISNVDISLEFKNECLKKIY